MSNSTAHAGAFPTSLQARAAAELEYRRRTRLRTERLVDFIPRITPKYTHPHHLAPLLDALERTQREPVRALVSIPPRHAKTETLLHGIAYLLERRPTMTVAYVTYADRMAQKKSKLARDYALRSGLVLRADSANLQDWRNQQMGGALFTSVHGQLTGDGADVLIIDDPHKDRAEAESSVMREVVWEWYQGTASTRLQPGGSIIACHTRWHPEDLIGRIRAEHTHEKFEDIHLPALSDDGKSLWPERWSVEALKRIELTSGAYDWASLYQGRPFPRGGSVFKDVGWYDPAKLPKGLRFSIGIDLASTASTKADYSACVVLGQAADETVYVLGVDRKQCEVPQFVPIISRHVDDCPGAEVLWHTSTTEKGTAQLLASMGLPVRSIPAVKDKFVRSQSVAAAWNAGKVLLPGGFDEYGQPVAKPSWVVDFVREVSTFTGTGDKHDDMVDAMSSAFTPFVVPPRGTDAGSFETEDFEAQSLG